MIRSRFDSARCARRARDERRTSPLTPREPCAKRKASRRVLAALVLLAGCAGGDVTAPIVVELGGAPDDVPITRTFDVEGTREVVLVAGDAAVVAEAWLDGGTLDGTAWMAPLPMSGEHAMTAAADGEVTLTVWPRGGPLPFVVRDRSLAWFDPALLDDASAISFARVMATIAADGHGGTTLDRWFRAFAAGPGAGRATFAQFLDEVATAQGPDPAAWDLAALPFRVTGIHNRVDLSRGADCGELRVSIASTHPTFAPVHLIFLFRQDPAAADVTPDGAIHCRGAARRWTRLTDLDDAAFAAAARDILSSELTRDAFLLAESVELSISPWQFRQWLPDGGGGFSNPPLFQTIDVARVDAPGPTRDAFLADVAANADAIVARTWVVPPAYRAPVAEVQPTSQGALVDLSPLPDLLAAHPELPRALGMIGCPRCHTDTADFVQTNLDRQVSPFYDAELEARAARLDALNRGERPAPAPFGPLQPL
jgi:hypothetical protein